MKECKYFIDGMCRFWTTPHKCLIRIMLTVEDCFYCEPKEK